MGCEKPVLRMGKMKAGPVVTDNGSVPLPQFFSPLLFLLTLATLETETLSSMPSSPNLTCEILPSSSTKSKCQFCHLVNFPLDLLTPFSLDRLTGVLEVGIFAGMALAAYFGNADGSVTVRWRDG